MSIRILIIKFFIVLCSFMLLLFLLVLIFPLGKSRDYMINVEKDKIKLYYDPSTDALSDFLLENKSNEIENIIGIYYDKTGDGISVNKKDSYISFHSEKSPSVYNVTLTLPLAKSGVLIGNLVIRRFSNSIESSYSGIVVLTISVFIFMLILMSAAALKLARNLNLFKKEITGAMKAFSEGSHNIRIFPSYRGQFKDLAESFNSMADQISSHITSLDKEKEEMQTIVSSISSGVAVLDQAGKIILANKVFMEMFGRRAVNGRFYWEIIINVNICDLITKVREEKTSLSAEIVHINRTYKTHLSFVPQTSETVLIFYDLTDIKNLEKIKKDFVDNVSHELKTPLTSIMGFTESLLEEEKDAEKKHRLDIIFRNTVRLVNIVKDLLSLSELEETPGIINIEKIRLADILQNIRDVFSTPIKMKSLYLDITIPEGLPEIEGDPFKIEQLFVNLIDNAIKYTDKGGITVKAYPFDGSVRVDIEDTGIGIPEEHIPRLFERFYVVNKARSKSLGGTGLGLSIVKHILLLHRGKISVGSRSGRGTKFVITLPLKQS